jgi:DNA repair protein RecN (Recombination protein N)
MLVELAVRNLGVIEDLRLAFGPGMCALTGETGAGKTMIVEAIGLLLGGRPDPARVRPGADETEVEGLFVLDDDREVVLRRVVPRVGRSRAYLDGRLVPTAQLAELGAGLVELHGQHAQQSLLRPRSQRDALDRYGSVDTAPLEAAAARCRQIESELAALGGDERARLRELDLLRYQRDELDSAAIDDADEDEGLDRLEDVLADATAHREAGAGALDLLAGDGGLVEQLATAVHLLDRRAPFGTAAERLRDLAAELDDVAHQLRADLETIEEDPARLAEVRTRRQLLVDLRRKYGETLADVMAYHAEVADQIADLEGREERTRRLEAALAAAGDELAAASRAVGVARRRAAPKLAAELEARLREVALAGARVEVAVGDDGDGSGDRVELLLAANPGMDAQPLAKVASGGELSRTMLALHLVLSGGPATMVFDEVDAGIGGATATAIGRALAGLAAERQVLVVTHLPQVAAYADVQIAVAKERDGAMTSSSIRQLDAPDRVIELSRMMSGSPESDSAREHARELLAAAAADRGAG